MFFASNVRRTIHSLHEFLRLKHYTFKRKLSKEKNKICFKETLRGSKLGETNTNT